MKKWMGMELVALLWAANAFAGEKVIARAEVPQPVIDAVQKRFPNGKLVRFERESEEGKVAYEVGVEEGTRKMDVDVTPDGHLVAIEEQVQPGAVPEAVRKAVATSKWNKLKVRRAEKVLEFDAAGREQPTTWELALAGGGKRVELVYDEAGTLRKEEAK